MKKKYFKKMMLSIAFFASFLPLSFAQTYQWVNMIGGDFDLASSMKTDAVGNVYAAGTFNGTRDFDPSAATLTMTSVGGTWIFISSSTILREA